MTPVLSQESEQSCICVLGVLILPLFTIFLLDFGTVSSVVFFAFHFKILVITWKRRFSHYIIKSTEEILRQIITHLWDRSSHIYETDHHTSMRQIITRLWDRSSHIYETDHHTSMRQIITRLWDRSSHVYETDHHTSMRQIITRLWDRSSHVYIDVWNNHNKANYFRWNKLSKRCNRRKWVTLRYDSLLNK
jgi:hypothetical protein